MAQHLNHILHILIHCGHLPHLQVQGICGLVVSWHALTMTEIQPLTTELRMRTPINIISNTLHPSPLQKNNQKKSFCSLVYVYLHQSVWRTSLSKWVLTNCSFCWQIFNVSFLVQWWALLRSAVAFFCFSR